ncbi:hypothetical protein U2F10_11620 [Leptothoe sp. EHU-05/26/07-4]
MGVSAITLRTSTDWQKYGNYPIYPSTHLRRQFLELEDNSQLTA